MRNNKAERCLCWLLAANMAWSVPRLPMNITVQKQSPLLQVQAAMQASYRQGVQQRKGQVFVRVMVREPSGWRKRGLFYVSQGNWKTSFALRTFCRPGVAERRIAVQVGVFAQERWWNRWQRTWQIPFAAVHQRSGVVVCQHIPVDLPPGSPPVGPTVGPVPPVAQPYVPPSNVPFVPRSPFRLLKRTLRAASSDIQRLQYTETVDPENGSLYLPSPAGTTPTTTLRVAPRSDSGGLSTLEKCDETVVCSTGRKNYETV